MSALPSPAQSIQAPANLAAAPAPSIVAPPTKAEQVRVESVAGGRFPTDSATQAKLCLLADGRLLIVHGQRLDPLVQQYEAGLRAARHTYRVDHVGLSDLREQYATAATQSAIKVVQQASESDRQQKVIQLVMQAARMGASDMHFIIKPDIGEIRYRINGLLETIKGNEMEADEVRVLLSTIYLSMLDSAGDAVYNEGKPQDGRIDQRFLTAAGLHGVRTATRPTDRGQIGILRLLYGGKRRSLDQLGYLPEQVALVRRMAQRRVGINILSGPTGSGKSTTLSAVFELQVAHFANQLHILTIEDPPETIIEGVNHTPVDRDGNNEPAWAVSIKNAMRLDPDVIGIGEMRDKSSAIAAFQAAMTGHAVWTTLHANDSFAIVQRLLELGVDAGLVMDPAILGMLGSQSLAPTLCPHCKTHWKNRPRNYDAGTAARVEANCDTTNVHVAAGCDRCRGTGAGGRTLLAELVETDLDLFRTYRKQGKAEARAQWMEQGGITKTRHLIKRVEEGLIDPIHAEAAVGLLDADRQTISSKHDD